MKHLTLILLLTLPLMADRTVTMTWDKPPEKVTVEIYRVVPGGVDVKLGSVPSVPGAPPETMVITIPDDEVTLYAVSVNDANPSAVVTSDKSDLLVIPKTPAKPGKLRVVKIETSANLTDWEPLAFVPLLTDSPARFIRAGIHEITP